MPRNAIRLISGNARHKRTVISSLTLLGAVLVILGVVLAPSIPAMSQAQFGDPAFRTQWERTDGAVASGAAQRGWIWGPVPGQTLSEPFNGLPGNAHQVQYFDKGRMEINNP